MVADGWSPSAAMEALAAVDALVAALARFGPEAERALAPALAATARARAVVVGPQDGERAAALAGAPPPRVPVPAGRHTVPEFWITRNVAVAERLWWGAQEGRGGPLADMFAALPPRAMEEAVLRRRQGEDWRTLLEDLSRRHAG
ncbi:hypothetical protein OG599_35010 (plasmid) [Streptomyces sp. NBC_01335]|uniref:hypothetical protein n=1 Tax=Streptomyces sp. NBC_01335 TaxID=2903828 RepID=UPI002E158218|nr:hypothetical protein OG599_35010 [Streptomyces sp. NBC_01335]